MTPDYGKSSAMVQIFTILWQYVTANQNKQFKVHLHYGVIVLYFPVVKSQDPTNQRRYKQPMTNLIS